MHILVTNDDGPPSPTSSPYVHSLVRELQKRGHDVSVCLPHTQRSWIGKAHIIGQTVKPLYYRPSETFDPSPSTASHTQGTTSTRPSKNSKEEEWILVDGTPASCAQIGLHHFFQEKGPIDLVVSGPNYGRNTTAVFALSSGTLGGAIEAAVCRKKSIALSYAFFNRNHDPTIIDAAGRHSVRVIEKLYEQWPEDRSVDLYSVNVPLIEGVEQSKSLWTEMLQNYWGDNGVCFEEVEGSIGDEDEEEERIREGEESKASEAPDSETKGDANEEGKTRYTHRHFKWAPRYTDVFKSVDESTPGNDGWAVKEGFTSITPLKANFYHAATHLHGEEFKLSNSELEDIPLSRSTLIYRPKQHFYALIAYEDPYVQPLILSALQKLLPPEAYTLLSIPEAAVPGEQISLSKLLPDNSSSQILQITPYEDIDWDYVDAHPRTCLVNSYMLRKALIRKHYLSATVEQWVAKRPESVLATHVKRSEHFELDYAEFLDDALVEAFDLRASLEENEDKEEKEREWWILKPGMSDRGQGIRLFATMEELQDIFDGWEVDSEDEDEDGSENGDRGNGNADAVSGRSADGKDNITTSHLRHFVAQPYIHPPLLLPANNRKFHIRTYVACVGSLDVYVYRHMLALFAGREYIAPGATHTATSTSTATDTPGSSNTEEVGDIDLEAHLTNTCLQRSVSDGTVQRFWDLELGEEKKKHIFNQICDVTGEVFEAAARAMLMHFRPLPNAFEVYGLDFLVDAQGTAWLLEVNAFPDFKQTGEELRGLVAGLWEDVLGVAVAKFFGVGGRDGEGRGKNHGENKEEERLVHVRHVDLGR
ncbi:sure-like protein [Annulohypoxylon maeteangense]|uniref:sure-like protein n=1 Tax=Annulohypoxylon maeteangense TaxID=1927788 RepID=UPI002007FBD2|nr:sure-like protein [Annulohypoxylon maeteangense]KAI0888192.1 sure-like protein [Annulohypoxylon maeteangense]